MGLRKRLLWTLLIGFSLSRSLVSGDTLEEVAGTGLVIHTNPSGATVYIDGIERGITPLGINSLAVGEYGVRLRKDGYVERRIRVHIKETSRLVLTLDLEEERGRLIIQVKRGPGGPPETGGTPTALRPELSVDGVPVDSLELSLPVGYRIIRVRAFGWREESQTIYIVENSTRLVDIELYPAEFRISRGGVSRPRFNPANPGSLGTTGLGFEVTAPGTGRLKVLNAAGEVVFTRNLERFTTWAQWIRWDGRSADGQVLPDGVYRVIIEGEPLPWGDTSPDAPPITERLELMVTIDSQIMIRPLSLASGIPGLIYAPAVETLPAGALQLEGVLLFGQPPLERKAWTTLPFSVGFRFAPLERLELAAALNVQADLEAGARSAATGSLKWQARKPGGAFPLGWGAALSYGWVEGGTTTPFGMDTGVKALINGSFQLGRFFSFLLSPEILWTGEDGYPDEPIPRALLAGGLEFHHSFITAGVSLRSEFRFDDRVGPLMLGAELKIFPPPSSFVLSLYSGAWFFGGSAGAYGGAGIGLIY